MYQQSRGIQATYRLNDEMVKYNRLWSISALTMIFIEMNALDIKKINLKETYGFLVVVEPPC